MRRTRVGHVFVEYLPDQLEPGVVYVSIEHALASHLCCCGCGHEVVTPFGRHDWKLTFDGVSVSLSPSIGNWRLPCRSHYWIQQDQVRWARPAPRPPVASAGVSATTAAASAPGPTAATTERQDGLARRAVKRLRSRRRRTDR